MFVVLWQAFLGAMTCLGLYTFLVGWIGFLPVVGACAVTTFVVLGLVGLAQEA